MYMKDSAQWPFKPLLALMFLATCVLSATVLAKSTSAEYAEIEWVALMPEKDLQALLNPPDYINDIVDGSAEDQIGKAPTPEGGLDSYQQALTSTDVIDSFNGQKVRIPGFIVPLEVDDAQAVTEFFLVPYFGACLHMPPPPPNQMIHVNLEQGFPLENLYDAFWLEGTLLTQVNANDLGVAAYALDVDSISLYQE